MICVIPLAGNSQRFLDKGYDAPKALLPIENGKPILKRVIESLPPYIKQVISISKPSLELNADLFSPFSWYPVTVKRNTAGPLDTLIEARALLRTDDELLIHYCDLFLPDNQCEEFIDQMRSKKRHAGVVCFPSDDYRFQREPSGRYAMSGIFYFQKASTFLKMAQGYRDDPNISPGHIAFACTWLGLNMASAFVTDNIVDLGIPESYELYKVLTMAKAVEIPK